MTVADLIEILDFNRSKTLAFVDGTIGYRLAQYAQDVLMDYAEVARVRGEIKGKGFKGAAGTSASYPASLTDVQGTLFFLAGGEWRQLALVLAITIFVGWLVVNIYPVGRSRVTSYLGGLQDQRPTLPISYEVLEQQAREKLSPEAYGYVAGGKDAPPDQEMRYIEEIRSRFYAGLADMPVPVSEENMRNYGVSSTPTLVLIDKRGLVRMYVSRIDHFVWIERGPAQPWLITPDHPDAFVRALSTRA